MRVPTPQVQDQALPGVRVQALDPYSSLMPIAGQVAGAMIQQKQERDASAYTDAMIQANKVDEQLTSEMASLKGDDFLKVDPSVWADRRQAKMDTILQSVPSSVQTHLRQRIDASGVNLQARMDAHRLEQQDFKIKTNFDAAAQDATSYAASHAFDQNGIDQRHGLALSAADQAFRGLSPEAKAQKEAVLSASILMARTSGMAQTDMKAARDFFDKNQEAMSAHSGFADFKAKFKGESDYIRSKEAADQAIATGKTMTVDKNGIGKYDWETARSTLMDSLKNEPEKMRDQALAIFDQGQQRWAMQRNLNIESAQAAVSKIAGQNGPSSALGSPALAAMIANPDTAEAGFNLKMHLQQWQHSLATQGKESMAERWTANFLPILMDPELQAQLTPQKVTSLIPLIGPQNAEQLGQLVAHMEAANSFPIPASVFNAVVAQQKYDMRDKDTAGMVKQAYDTAATELLALKKAGVKVDNDKIHQVLMENLAQHETVTRERSFWWDKTGKLPMGAMTPQQQAQAVDRIDTDEKAAFMVFAKAKYGVSKFKSDKSFMQAFDAWKAAGSPNAASDPSSQAPYGRTR